MDDDKKIHAYVINSREILKKLIWQESMNVMIKDFSSALWCSRMRDDVMKGRYFVLLAVNTQMS